MARRTITTSATRRARAARSRFLPPPERQPAQWRLFACHVNAGCVLEATSCTLHYGLAPKDKGLPPVVCPFIPRMLFAASAARRTRAASLRVSPPVKRQPAQWRLVACHANVGCPIEATARTSHHGLAPQYRGLPPEQRPLLVRRWITTSAARLRARQDRVFCHLPRDSQRSGACSSRAT